MKINLLETGQGTIALCESAEPVIRSGQSALDLIANLGYAHNCRNLVLNKAAICETFFDLSTGLAGEVAQKFVNYNARLAIIGSFSTYPSRALQDYIYECNKNGPLYFVSTEAEALQSLTET